MSTIRLKARYMHSWEVLLWDCAPTSKIQVGRPYSSRYLRALLVFRRDK